LALLQTLGRKNDQNLSTESALYEDMVASLIRNCPANGVFVDGGAHMGLHTFNMLARPDVDAVLAIEDIPGLANAIRERFKQQTKLKIVQAAIGNAEGQTEFNIAANAMGYSGIRMRDIADATDWRSLTVNLTTLDRLILESGWTSNMGLIKLDLEGGEFDALRGASNTLISHRPFVVFENGLSRSANLYGYTWNEFSNFFNDAGYIDYDIFGNCVDKEYWDATLLTYMFVAVPANSEYSMWYERTRPEIVSEIACRL